MESVGRNELELGAYAFVAVFNAGSFLWWCRFLYAAQRPRAAWLALFASGAILTASLAVATSQGVYAFDRGQVVQVGRWLRPILAASLFLAGLAHFYWSWARRSTN